MSSLESRLRKSKKRWEDKLKTKKKRRDVLGKQLFDFPNMTIPLNLMTFSPAFLTLAAAAKIFGAYQNVGSLSIMLGFFGFFCFYIVTKLEKQWFTPYGTKEIIQEEIPWHKGFILTWLLCCAVIVGAGAMIQTPLAFFIYIVSFGIGFVYLALHKDAVLWDMPPARILGFRKYKFIPKNGDNHTVKNGTYQCVMRKFAKLNNEDKIEGTFIGSGWHYLRKEKG